MPDERVEMLVQAYAKAARSSPLPPDLTEQNIVHFRSEVESVEAQLAQAKERNAELREALAHALTLLGHPEDIVTQALWRTLEQGDKDAS